MIGRIQWRCLSAVHPYQSSANGIKNVPGIIGGRRNSGLEVPFFSERYWSSRSETEPTMNRPMMEPTPIPRYASPTLPCEKPYWPSKTAVMVVKRR